MFNNTIVDWNGITGNDLGPNMIGDGASATIFFNRPDVSTANHMMRFRGYGSHYVGFSVEGSNAQIGDNSDVLFFNCGDCYAQDIRVNNVHNSSTGGSDIDVRSVHMSLRDVGGITGGLEVGDSNPLCEINSATDITWEHPFCSNG